MEIPNKIKEIMQKLLDNGFEAFIVGGTCRDYLLGVEPHDYDIFSNATGEHILEIFPQGKVLGGEERQSKILTVIVDGIEISQYRSNGDRTETGVSFEEHINTCDFRLNSMACGINGEIIDLNNGKSDIKHKQIVFVGKAVDRIKEDPLRLLRMIRFAAKYDFEIVYNYNDYIGETIELLDTLPGERIKEELEKILKYDSSIEKLKEFDILYHIFPEFEMVKEMTGGDKHNELVIEHLEESFKTTCSITNDFKLRFAALFHDIGKGVTKDISVIPGDLDKNTFYGHEEEGEKIFLKYAEKYKFSNDEIKFIVFLIRNHMFGYHMENINNNTLVKFFTKMENAGVTIMDFVTMLYCDHQGNLAKPRIKFKEFIEGNFFYNKYNELKKTMPFRIVNLEIDGNDLIKLGYVGKDIGHKLNQLYEMVLDGEVINRKDRLMEMLLR